MINLGWGQKMDSELKKWSVQTSPNHVEKWLERESK